MATHQPKRPSKPRLSLKIQTTSASSGPETAAPAATVSGQQRATHNVDPGDITTFNTLSNAYATAIQRSTPLTAINTLERLNLATPSSYRDPRDRIMTPYLTTSYPETPLSADHGSGNATSSSSSPPSSRRRRQPALTLPSIMTTAATTTTTTTTTPPPLSGTLEDNRTRAFNYPSSSLLHCQDAAASAADSTVPFAAPPPPYTQPRVLRSILRNSPLPPRTAILPPSPRRQSLRLRERAARRVAYNSPLEQEIVTSIYTEPCIDLMYSPGTPPSSSSGSASSPSPFGNNNGTAVSATADQVLDHVLAPTTRDGGQTPGPFEETRRRMTRSATTTSSSPPPSSSPSGVRKRRSTGRKDRRWVWTTHIEEDEEEDDDEVGGAVAALRAARAREEAAKAAAEKAEAEASSKVAEEVAAAATATVTPEVVDIDVEATPTPSAESCCSWSEDKDVDMTDASSIASEVVVEEPAVVESDVKTPTVPSVPKKRDTPIPELATDSQRATPVPPLLTQ
ncbi:hypothetical protein GMORB2_5533 [Geosmithia morbida]|uniref:Uncharacterized protein n=1 Tax=Geosmithia morbida TaxID=1094350 RepID=A0A9P4YXW4_9HYPO|nr:uncharacterized protein GMORB2_5533 [Geosmithia morbida]KAF4123817.1 hypothetical protein GMORB2_5533 [Geosmithia morbida]